MQATIDMSAVFGSRAQCELRVMCGPKYNAFGLAEDRREEPGRFFQRAVWKAISKPVVNEDETERWDGLE